MGKVVAILVAAGEGAPMTSMASATLETGKGIVGDRYHGLDPDAQVTLVDADVLDAVNATTGWQLAPADTRRNIVTRGIDLNQSETGELRVGDAVLQGVELCEPCANLGGLLETADRDAVTVVKALTHKGGLRARVIHGAEVAEGDSVSGE